MTSRSRIIWGAIGAAAIQAAIALLIARAARAQQMQPETLRIPIPPSIAARVFLVCAVPATVAGVAPVCGYVVQGRVELPGVPRDPRSLYRVVIFDRELKQLVSAIVNAAGSPTPRPRA